MSEPTPASAPEAAQPEAAPETAEPAQDTTDWKAEARKWEQRAKKNNDAAEKLAEVEKARKAAMTESERAVAEAEERGRTAVRSEYGQRLARTEFIAEAAKRNPGFDTAAVLDDINLARYIGEDGEPDSKAIAAAVGRLVPEGSATPPSPPSFDGGTRQTAVSGPSMNDLIRQAAGRA